MATTKLKVGAADLLEQCRQAIRETYGEDSLDREWDPLVESAVHAANPNLDPRTRATLNSQLIDYFYAKRKPVDESGNSDGLIIQLVSFGDLAENPLARVALVQSDAPALPAPPEN